MIKQEEIANKLESRLDKIEDRLPELPAAAFRLQRRVGERAVTGVTDAAHAMRVSSGAVAKATANATKTVSGTTSWATKRTAGTVVTAGKTIVGQARAQAKIAGSVIAKETKGLVRSARNTSEDLLEETTEILDNVAEEVDNTTPAGAYETWTKSDLYDRAQELDLDGRSSMTKPELIAALRSAN